MDGYAQSIPYHLCVYICPIHKYLFVALFGLVNLWSIFIHDSDMICDSGLEHYVNGPSHHTLHHIYFNCNYGQYWTVRRRRRFAMGAPCHCADTAEITGTAAAVGR